MKKIHVLFTLLLCTVGLVGYFLFSSSSDKASPIENMTQDKSSIVKDTASNGQIKESEEITSSWPLHTNLSISFKYPPEAKAETRNDSTVPIIESVVFFMGQKQIDSGRTQTELFDGYAFNIRDITSEVTENFEAFAKTERDNAEEGCDYDRGFVSELNPTKIGQVNGFQFYANNCYIDYTQTYLESNGKFYRISQSYVGDPENYDQYKKTTFSILNTLSFVKM